MATAGATGRSSRKSSNVLWTVRPRSIVISPKSAAPRPDLVHPEQWSNWALTDRGVYFLTWPDAGDPQLVVLDLEEASATPRRLTRLPEFAWPGITVSRDGTRVIYTHADRRDSNIGGLFVNR